MRRFPNPGLLLTGLVALPLLLTACPDESISVYETSPQARIDLPVDGDQLDTATVTFIGIVDDAQDAGDEMAVAWTSSLLLDEPLLDDFADSAGVTEFTYPDMPAGEQLITLTVTDTAGATGQDSITILVLPDAPLVQIEQPLPGDEFYTAETITLRGNVQSTDGLELVMEVEWTSSQDGILGGGSSDAGGVTEVLTQLDPGPHTITLTATDSYGVSGADSVSIEVLAYPPGQLDQDFDGYCPDGVDADMDGICDEDELTGVGSQDCDDADADSYPGAPELCDGMDNDCDGLVPDDEVDSDGDGWEGCAGDCDDGNPAMFPGNPELCDALDNDCNTLVDEHDADVDADSWSLCDGDCNDNNAEIYPAATELCNGLDDNCDGNIDELDVDLDFDGVSVCSGDCDDADAANFPGNPEVCDDQDNNCDGVVDENDANVDGDPASLCDGDCLDTNPNVYPGAPELCDGLDNNCDGFIPLDEYDLDADGWRPCEGDCDDGQPLMNPGETEICDALDNDCDGIINENADPTEVGESTSSAYGEAIALPGFDHIFNFPFPCSGGSCPIFGGLEICENNISTTGAFASADDVFDAYWLDYDQMVTIFGCDMTVTLSGIPAGHDYSLFLYRTDSLSDPVGSWDLLQSSDNAGNSSESITQGSTSWLDFSTDTFVVVVLSKGNWACPVGSYTLTVVGG